MVPVSRKLIAALFRPLTGVYTALRPGIRILMYHRINDLPAHDQLTVPPDLFAEQMAILAGRHRVFSLVEAVTELRRGRSRAGVVITFDDGYRDNFSVALPILKRFNLPATFFVSSRFCDQDISHPRYDREGGRLHLDWTEIRQLAGDPAITIGAHTMTHPFLSRLTGEEAWEEIAGSRRDIEAAINRPVEFFCYPSGDHGSREIELVGRAGYTAAVTVAPGLNRGLAQPFALHRTEVTYKDTPPQFEAKLVGAFDPVHIMLHWRRQRSFRRLAASGERP